MRLPSPPIVSATLSGFVIGVFVTLAASGVLNRPMHTQASATLPAATPVRSNVLDQRVRRLLVRQLGPYTADKQPRVVALKLVHVRSLEALSDPLPDMNTYRSVYVDFRLNDHPLGKSWRLKAAKADVFAVMKALYTSNLPVYDVQLTGVFAFKGGGRAAPVLVAYETHEAAARIPWKRWGRENEALLWNDLPYKQVNKRFG